MLLLPLRAAYIPTRAVFMSSVVLIAPSALTPFDGLWSIQSLLQELIVAKPIRQKVRPAIYFEYLINLLLIILRD
jgi:hypothetical protein